MIFFALNFNYVAPKVRICFNTYQAVIDKLTSKDKHSKDFGRSQTNRK